MKRLTLFLLLLPLFVIAQEEEKENYWKPFDIFIGSWIGDETGKAGRGKGERTYEYILDKKFIFSKNVSRFEPQEKNPDGEIHEDWGFFSYDKNRKNFILREFFIESYVIQYLLDSLSVDQRTIIFTSENVENAPDGLRARVTYKIQNKDAFTEIFELAMPGKEFSIYLRNFWRRKI